MKWKWKYVSVTNMDLKLPSGLKLSIVHLIEEKEKLYCDQKQFEAKLKLNINRVTFKKLPMR